MAVCKKIKLQLAKLGGAETSRLAQAKGKKIQLPAPLKSFVGAKFFPSHHNMASQLQQEVRICASFYTEAQ